MFFLLLSFFRAWKRAYLGAIDDDGYYHYWRKALFIVWRRETASLFVCFCSCIRSFKPLIVTRTRRRTHFWRRDGKRCRFLFVLSFFLSFFLFCFQTDAYAIDCYDLFPVSKRTDVSICHWLLSLWKTDFLVVSLYMFLFSLFEMDLPIYHLL